MRFIISFILIGILNTAVAQTVFRTTAEAEQWLVDTLSSYSMPDVFKTKKEAESTHSYRYKFEDRKLIVDFKTDYMHVDSPSVLHGNVTFIIPAQEINTFSPVHKKNDEQPSAFGIEMKSHQFITIIFRLEEGSTDTLKQASIVISSKPIDFDKRRDVQHTIRKLQSLYTIEDRGK